MTLRLVLQLRRVLPPGVELSVRRALNVWRTAPFLRHLRKLYPEDYNTLMREDIPPRLRLALSSRLAADKRWGSWPARCSTPAISTDVLFVSYRAHPDLVKHCIALKRERPGIRCALAVEQHAHTQRLCQQWFDEVVVLGKSDPPRLLALLRNARAGVVILRYRDLVFNTLARLLYEGPLVYSPPGFFLSSRTDDYNSARLPLRSAFLADKFLLEKAGGVIHWLSDEAIAWFESNGVRISCPARTVYSGCMPELEPRVHLPKLSETDGEWHIVHATGVTPNKGQDLFLSLAKCELVVSQGIHLHVYGTYFDRNNPGYRPYIELEERSRYFHIEGQLEFDDLLITMTQYDLAWKHWDVSQDPLWPAFSRHITPNFFAYIQSGLPLLMSPLAPPLEVQMAREQGIGVFVGEDELPSLRQILNQTRDSLQEMGRRVQQVKAGVFSYDTKAIMKVIGPYLSRGTT